MFKMFLPILVAVLATFGFVASPAWASDDQAWFADSEIDELLGPVALYPDPLLAQILPAATFSDQLSQAYTLINLKGGSNIIDDQDWDVSVKSVAHYTSVLKMMVEYPDWTTSIGQAYVNQPEDVMKSIQRLRGKAKLTGYLTSSNEQEVIYDQEYIRIVPADPQYVFIPVYVPTVVYVESSPANDVLKLRKYFCFGPGLRIGAWLNRDCDWRHYMIFYHGWAGEGWISRCRPHVYTNNIIYVNNYYTTNYISVNRGIVQTDVSSFRNGIRRKESVRPLPDTNSRKVSDTKVLAEPDITQTVRQEPRNVRPISDLPVFNDQRKPQAIYNTHESIYPDPVDAPAKQPIDRNYRYHTTAPGIPVNTSVPQPIYQPTNPPKPVENVQPKQIYRATIETPLPSSVVQKETPKFTSNSASSVRKALPNKTSGARPNNSETKNSEDKNKPQ